MRVEKIKVRLTFTEPTLATSPGNKELLEEFIAKKAPNSEKAAEELAAAPADEQTEKASTVFPRDTEGYLHCWDYNVRGMLKEKIAMLIETGDLDRLSKWSYKKAVDLFVHANPRRLYFTKDGSKIKQPDGTLQRPLRATTMQGDRICLARSEYLSPGTQLEFEVECHLAEPEKKKTTAVVDVDTVKECLDLLQFVGFSQWRGGGFGKCTWEEVKS